MGFGVNMAKSKKHTTHNRSQKWRRNGIKIPWKQRYESLKGVDALRNMFFAKKHNKKSLKKIQANNAKALSAQGYQGPHQAKGGQAQDPKG